MPTFVLCCIALDTQPESLNTPESEEDDLVPEISQLKIENVECTPCSDKSPHTKKPCKFGLGCYDHSDLHRARFSHPTSTEETPQPTKPPRPCRYGAKCFDTSGTHRAQFSHPPNMEDDGPSTKQPKLCFFGAKCYDMSALHRARFQHPEVPECTEFQYFSM